MPHDSNRNVAMAKISVPLSRERPWLPVQPGAWCQGQHENESLTVADRIVQKIWRPIALGLCIAIPAAYFVYTRLIGKRYATALHIPPEMFEKKPFLRGRVISVGDSDNFRLYHTPGFGWGWLRKVPTTRKELKDQTISIRLAGIDAPEGAHFGMPAQKLSAESKAFLTSMVLGRNVKVQLLSRDQYNRVVAMTYVRRPPFYRLKNVSVEMCKAGMACLYVNKGAQYGDHYKALKQAEERAQLLRKGIWGLKDYVSPGDHKARFLRHDKSS